MPLARWYICGIGWWKVVAVVVVVVVEEGGRRNALQSGYRAEKRGHASVEPHLVPFLSHPTTAWPYAHLALPCSAGPPPCRPLSRSQCTSCPPTLFPFRPTLLPTLAPQRQTLQTAPPPPPPPPPLPPLPQTPPTPRPSGENCRAASSTSRSARHAPSWRPWSSRASW